MRLLKGHDYYDSAMAFGTDSQVVFVRDRIVLDTDDKVNAYFGKKNEPILRPVRGFGFHAKGKVSWRDRWRRHTNVIRYRHAGVDTEVVFSSVLIMVAGKRYHGIRAHEKISNQILPTVHFFWHLEGLRDYVESFDYEIRDESINSYNHDENTLYSRNFFDPVTPDKEFDYCIEKRISTLTYGHDTVNAYTKSWVINGDNLQNYQLAKCLDPYKCFQELSMWVGGILPKEGPPMVEITDDKIKAAKHGMDKWSFRRTNAHKPNS